MAKDIEKKAVKSDKAKSDKKENKKEKKPNFFAKVGKFFSDCFKELKKISWPTRKDLFKLTGAVIVFMLIMTVILGAMDVLGTLMLQGLT